MIQEIYIREPADPNYKLDILDHSDPIESIISKIKMIFGTHQGQIFGDLNFGLGLENLIFETRINKIQLEEDIKRQISEYVSEVAEYKIEPAVSFGLSKDGHDYCVIDIFIDDIKTFGILVK